MSYAQAYYGGAGVITGAATSADGSYLNGSISAAIEEQKLVTIACNQTVENLTLVAVFETKDGTDVATISSGSLSNVGTNVTLVLPAATTTIERTLRWSISRTDTSELVASGLLFVTRYAVAD